MTFDLISRNGNGKGKVYNSSFPSKDMTKTNTIIDYLKSLEDIDLKKIRKEYVMGEDLAKIIAGHSAEKSKAMTKVFNLIKFEFDEQERFLKTYETLRDVRLFFLFVEEYDYKKVIEATLQGMRDGVENFLAKENKSSLYLSRLSYFCYDKAVARNIEQKVTGLALPLFNEMIPKYSEDIQAGYVFFLGNESNRKFEKKFYSKK